MFVVSLELDPDIDVVNHQIVGVYQTREQAIAAAAVYGDENSVILTDLFTNKIEFLTGPNKGSAVSDDMEKIVRDIDEDDE